MRINGAERVGGVGAKDEMFDASGAFSAEGSWEEVEEVIRCCPEPRPELSKLCLGGSSVPVSGAGLRPAGVEDLFMPQYAVGRGQEMKVGVWITAGVRADTRHSVR